MKEVDVSTLYKVFERLDYHYHSGDFVLNQCSNYYFAEKLTGNEQGMHFPPLSEIQSFLLQQGEQLTKILSLFLKDSSRVIVFVEKPGEYFQLRFPLLDIDSTNKSMKFNMSSEIKFEFPENKYGKFVTAEFPPAGNIHLLFIYSRKYNSSSTRYKNLICLWNWIKYKRIKSESSNRGTTIKVDDTLCIPVLPSETQHGGYPFLVSD